MNDAAETRAEKAAELRRRFRAAASFEEAACPYLLLIHEPEATARDLLDGLSQPGTMAVQAAFELHGRLGVPINGTLRNLPGDRGFWESVLAERRIDLDAPCPRFPGAETAAKTLLTFDAEEFDIPAEFGGRISEAEQMDVATRGHEAVLSLLSRLGVHATFFTTARFALARPELIRRTAAAGHEIASHGFNHTGFQDADLERSRLALEEVAGVPVRGFRMPRMGKVAAGRLLAAGYRYSSSENPTWIPGRYNLLRAPRTARLDGELLCIPASVTPRLRFPLFWISFKTFPLWVARAAAARCLAADGYVSLYFHPWEYTDLSAYPAMPRCTRRPDGARLLAKLESFLVWLKARSRFATFAEFDAATRPRLRQAHVG